MATAAEVEFWKDMCRKESARNNKLRSEWNEAIRQQLAADDARKTAEAVTNGLEWEVEELTSENAKLRELLQRLLAEYRYMRIRPRKVYLQHEGRMRVIEEEMRELGIEVE